MKSSGPSPVITIAEQPGCLLVKFHGIQVAASSRALVLLEANYPPVYYVPREDIDEKYFARTDHTSYCPYKGDASYFSLQVPGHEGANAVWSYENPKVSVAQIREYMAFYPDQVKFELVELDDTGAPALIQAPSCARSSGVMPVSLPWGMESVATARA